MATDNEGLLARMVWLVETGRVGVPEDSTRNLAIQAVDRHFADLDRDGLMRQAALMQAQRLWKAAPGEVAVLRDEARAWFPLFELEETGVGPDSNAHRWQRFLSRWKALEKKSGGAALAGLLGDVGGGYGPPVFRRNDQNYQQPPR